MVKEGCLVIVDVVKIGGGYGNIVWSIFEEGVMVNIKSLDIMIIDIYYLKV